VIVAGLTGSIAMGKTETAKMFASLGVPVFDADACVHDLYEKGGAAVSLVEAAFPGTVSDGAVDRARLSARVLNDPAALRKLELLVHPLVRKAQAAFTSAASSAGHGLVVLDIPLLFESGLETTVDRVIVVSAPEEVQRARALARDGMTEEKLQAILARQVPDSEKRSRADFVVDSSQGLDHAFAQVKSIVAKLRREGAEGPQ
jgi:dephospho-CoA kinase